MEILAETELRLGSEFLIVKTIEFSIVFGLNLNGKGGRGMKGGGRFFWCGFEGIFIGSLIGGCNLDLGNL